MPSALLIMAIRMVLDLVIGDKRGSDSKDLTIYIIWYITVKYLTFRYDIKINSIV